MAKVIVLGGCGAVGSVVVKTLAAQDVFSQIIIGDINRHIDDIVGQVPAGSHQLIFLPWLNGERTPVDDTTLRGGFHRLCGSRIYHI